MSTYSQTLTSHGDILANIPGILGFYPQDSLVFAFLERNDDTHSLSLGPLARLDLKTFADLAHALNLQPTDLYKKLHHD